MALNVKIGKIGPLDMLKFSKMPDVREQVIQSTPLSPLPKAYASNAKAELYHPKWQKVVIDEIRQNGADAKTLVLKSENGKALAPFRAGQYISLAITIGQTCTTRSYSLCGSPEWAYQGIYNITVKRDDEGFVSPFIHDHFEVGQKLKISSPEGHLYYEPIRDCKKVLALAGGSGITPFMGMAYAIRDGFEDFDLTIIFGSRKEEGIVYRKELDEVAAACSKVHIVHVLSDEEKEGFEHGFISADLIEKYAAGEEVTVFMCGPQAMYNFLDGVVAELGLDRKHVRRELFGMIKDPWNQPGYPKGAQAQSFLAKVTVLDKTYTIPVSSSEPLLTAFDRAKICAPSRCRSGECGWCRSRLISGEVFIPEKTDGRREADKEFGYIHPCSTFPLSDVVVEVPGQYQHR
jgi:ferredoxin-NADP reductase